MIFLYKTRFNTSGNICLGMPYMCTIMHLYITIVMCRCENISRIDDSKALTSLESTELLTCSLDRQKRLIMLFWNYTTGYALRRMSLFCNFLIIGFGEFHEKACDRAPRKVLDG